MPLSMAFFMDEDGTRLTAGDGTRQVRVDGPAPERAERRALDEENARRNLTRTGGTQYYVNSFTADLAPGLTLPASALNALRREAVERLDERRGEPGPMPRGEWSPAAKTPRRHMTPSPLWARFFSPSQLPEELPERVILPAGEITPELTARLGERLTAELPAVRFPGEADGLEERLARLRDAGLGSVWAENIYDIELGRRLGLTVRGGFGLNVANTEAAAFYERQGLASLTASFELPMGAVKALAGGIPLGLAAYGRLPLMRYRNCPLRANIGCAACGGAGYLTDRKGVAFPVECGERRYSTLLNSVPLDIAGRDDPGDFRLMWFTRESREECAAVLGRFRRGEKPDGPHTGGLYYRKLL